MIYNEKINHYFNLRAHVGRLQQANVRAEIKKAGRHIVFYLNVDGDRITDIGYQVFGSTILIAGCAYIAEQLQQTTITKCNDLTHQHFTEFFDVPQAQISTSLLLEDIVKKIQEMAHGNG